MSLDPPPRTLVLCFDGTDGEFNEKNSNVVKFFSLLEKNSEDRQLCYYQTGIGTYTNPGIVPPIAKWIAMVADMAIAWYLDHHVMSGYRFLMQNFRDCDKICLFGFSRGAYTARALAAMLYSVGLLPKDNLEQVPFAYKVYRSTAKGSAPAADKFKRTFSRNVTIEFVGCWDTVSSTGLLYSKTLPFTSSNSSIKIFRHALALDERRTKFQPNLWHRPAPNRAASLKDPQNGSPVMGHCNPLLIVPYIPGELDMPLPRAPTDVLEVWFTGSHTDIGGGNQKDSEFVSLSDITLRWMVREVVRVQSGILFNKSSLKNAGILDDAFQLSVLLDAETPQKDQAECSHKGDALERTIRIEPENLDMKRQHFYKSPKSTEKRDRKDALSPITDSLRHQPWWWFGEIIPFRRSWQDANGVWHRKWRVNLGRGRHIQEKNPNFYITVQERMQDLTLSYRPKAAYLGEPQWIS